jgi:hypothetical protein
MKNIILGLILVVLVMLNCLHCTKVNTQRDFVGNWIWESPSNPEGFRSGTIEVYNDSVIYTFDGMKERFHSSNVTFKKDSLIYTSLFMGEEAVTKVKLENKTMATETSFMSGTEAHAKWTKQSRPGTKK